MENREAARTIFGVASLLESQGANPYRVRAYRRAALILMRLPEQAAALTGEDGQLQVSWLGDRLRRKVGELVTHGQMQFHQDLLAELPKPLRSLLAVPGIGPKTADRLMRELGVRSPKGVIHAARHGRIRRLRGFGPASEARLLAAAQGVVSPEASTPSALSETPALPAQPEAPAATPATAQLTLPLAA